MAAVAETSLPRYREADIYLIRSSGTIDRHDQLTFGCDAASFLLCEVSHDVKEPPGDCHVRRSSPTDLWDIPDLGHGVTVR